MNAPAAFRYPEGVIAWPDGRERPTILDADYDRRQYIGSSNVAAIMALAPTIGGERYTALDVYLAKIAPKREEDMDPKLRLFLERRKRLEPYAFQMLDEEFHAALICHNRRYIDVDYPFFASEIDAETVLDGEVVNVEVKTVSARAFSPKFGWGEPGTNEVPIHYYLQVQHGLGLTGRRRAFVAALVGFDQMEFYPIDRSEDDIAQIRERCSKFWTENVLGKLPPDPQTLADLDALYPNVAKSDSLSVMANSEVASKALRLRAINSMQSALTLEAEALEFDVKLVMKDKEELIVEGDRCVTWKEQNWSRLDQPALKTKEPKIHKAFMISGRQRVLRTLAGWKPT